MTDELARLEARRARAAGVAAFFQLGTLAWIRRRGLDLDDYAAYLASFSWATTKPGVGARRIADIVAEQIAAPETVSASASGDDSEARVDIVGPDPELLAWAGADGADLYREIELVFGPLAARLGHTFELEHGEGAGRITVRPIGAGRVAPGSDRGQSRAPWDT